MSQGTRPLRGQSSSQSNRRVIARQEHEDEEEEEEEQEEEEAALTPAELTQHYADEVARIRNQRTIQSCTDEEMDKITGELMRLMIFKNHKDPGVPVKREDLVDEVNKTYKNRRNMSSYVIANAQAKFSSMFGLEMKEVRRTRLTKNGVVASQGEGSAAKSSSYLLRSMLPEDVRLKFVETPREAAIKALALVVAALISNEGEKMEEKTLWNFLARLGILEKHENHPTFGNVEHTMQALIKQRYIQIVKNPNADNELCYHLAENALVLLGRKNVERFQRNLLG